MENICFLTCTVWLLIAFKQLECRSARYSVSLSIMACIGIEKEKIRVDKPGVKKRKNIE